MIYFSKGVWIMYGWLTEFLIETPRKDLNAAATSYSNYKSRLTAKYLIGVAPNGAITFVSEGYPGNTSDKFVTHFTRKLHTIS